MKKLSRVQKKTKRKRMFLSTVFILFIGFAIFILMINAGFFSIDSITVLGNEKVLENKIVLLSSIQKGENIFKISIKNAEKNITTLPYIKNVKVKRRFPKEVIINIEERQEIIQIQNISSFAIIDNEGYILDNIDKKDESLTEVVGLNIQNKVIGEDVFVNNEDGLKVEFIRKSEELNMLSKFKYINMEDDTNINILTFDEIEVVFGIVNNVEYKLRLLVQVLNNIEEEKLNVKTILMNKGENLIVVLEDKEEG